MQNDPFALPPEDIPSDSNTIETVPEVPVDTPPVEPQDGFALPAAKPPTKGLSRGAFIGIIALIVGIIASIGAFYILGPAANSRASEIDNTIAITPRRANPTPQVTQPEASAEAVASLSATTVPEPPGGQQSLRFLTLDTPADATVEAFTKTKKFESYTFSKNPEKKIHISAGIFTTDNLIEVIEGFATEKKQDIQKLEIDGKEFTGFQYPTKDGTFASYVLEDGSLQYQFNLINFTQDEQSTILKSIQLKENPSSPTLFLKKLAFDSDRVSGKLPNDYTLYTWEKDAKSEVLTFSAYEDTSTQIARMSVAWSELLIPDSVLNAIPDAVITSRTVSSQSAKLATWKASTPKAGYTSFTVTGLMRSGTTSFQLTQDVNEKNGNTAQRKQDFNYFLNNLQLK